MRFSYVAAGVLVLVLGLWMATGLLPSQGSEEADAQAQAEQADAAAPMKVEYIDVQLSPKSREIVLQGQLEPRKHLLLRAETSSTVEAILAQKGSLVNKGDTILKLSLDGRETDLREAQAQLQTASSQNKAAASLRKKGLQSQAVLEQSQAALASARAQLDRIKRDISNTNVTAPFDGVVNSLPIEVGEMIDRGAMVAELVDISAFKVTAQVAQQTLASLELNKNIEVKVITGETLPGKLTFISSVANSSSRSFAVEAEVENTDGNIAAGVSASLIVPVEQVEAVFISPSALSLGDSGELGVKLIDADNKVEFAPIKLISSTLEGAWVTGIPDNSRVITLGQGFVKQGQEVDPVQAQSDASGAS